MSILGRCPPYRGAKNMTEVQQKPTLGVRFRGRCPPHRELKNMTEEQQGPTLGVCFREVSVL